MLKVAEEKKRKLNIVEEKRIRREDIAKLKAQQRAEVSTAIAHTAYMHIYESTIYLMI